MEIIHIPGWVVGSTALAFIAAILGLWFLAKRRE